MRRVGSSLGCVDRAKAQLRRSNNRLGAGERHAHLPRLRDEPHLCEGALSLRASLRAQGAALVRAGALRNGLGLAARARASPPHPPALAPRAPRTIRACAARRAPHARARHKRARHMPCRQGGMQANAARLAAILNHHRDFFLRLAILRGTRREESSIWHRPTGLDRFRARLASNHKPNRSHWLSPRTLENDHRG